MVSWDKKKFCWEFGYNGPTRLIIGRTSAISVHKSNFEISKIWKKFRNFLSKIGYFLFLTVILVQNQPNIIQHGFLVLLYLPMVFIDFWVIFDQLKKNNFVSFLQGKIVPIIVICLTLVCFQKMTEEVRSNTLIRTGEVGLSQEVGSVSLRGAKKKQTRFAQKQMKSGLGKNGGGEDFPQGPLLYCSILIPHCQKCFWKNLSIFVDRTKNIFGRIVFRPNIQALEKNVAKMEIFILPLLYWPEIAKMFHKNFGRMF